MEWGVHKTPPSQRLGTAEHKSSARLPGQQEFCRYPSTAQLKEYGGQHASHALLEDLCWSLPCVHSVPGWQPKCLTMPYNLGARCLFIYSCKAEQCSLPTQRWWVGRPSQVFMYVLLLPGKGTHIAARHSISPMARRQGTTFQFSNSALS